MNRGKLKNGRRRKSTRIKCIGFLVVAAITIWATIGLREEAKEGGDGGGGDFLGSFGTMMVEMLPEDVPFTVFVPSERAFKRHLGLSSNATLTDDVYAIVSRLVGFSAIPRALSSADVAPHRLSSYDSISGFALYISKDRRGMLLVNGVRSQRVDLRTKQVVVHLMDGVIMDSQFQESF